MNRRIVSVLMTMVLVLTSSLVTAIPVAANGEDEVFIKVRGKLTLELPDGDAVAKVRVTMDSVSGECIGIMRFGKAVWNPYVGGGQWMKGIYGEADLVSWEISGSTITLDVGPMPMYVLPSGDLWGIEENPGYINGTISRNKVTLDFGGEFTDMIGTIRIK